MNGSYNNSYFEEFGRDLALFDRWFQTMTRKMGSHYDKKLKFATNLSNGEIRKVRKFRNPIDYWKKVIKTNLIRGGGGGGESANQPPLPRYEWG